MPSYPYKSPVLQSPQSISIDHMAQYNNPAGDIFIPFLRGPEKKYQHPFQGNIARLHSGKS
jgi:hypothetical protein